MNGFGRAVYISHPQVNVDANVPVTKWGLSPIGQARAEAFASKSFFADTTVFFSSAETKAIELAQILAGTKTIKVDKETGENDRSSTGFLPPDVFEIMADRFFASPDQSIKGWERAIDAQTRIVSAVTMHLRAVSDQSTRVFCGHGAVGTLLKCDIDRRAISRREDQPAGGGNLFVFEIGTDLAPGALICDWTPMEDWKGF